MYYSSLQTTGGAKQGALYDRGDARGERGEDEARVRAHHRRPEEGAQRDEVGADEGSS